VELEAKPIDILLQLLLHAGEVVTKEELLESVWPDVMFGNDQILCGNVASAQWVFTPQIYCPRVVS
jgi:DNA-binding winged helix-turn-helix (wHTH) protein